MRAVVCDDGQLDLESPSLWDYQVAAHIAFSHETVEHPNRLAVTKQSFQRGPLTGFTFSD